MPPNVPGGIRKSLQEYNREQLAHDRPQVSLIDLTPFVPKRVGHFPGQRFIRSRVVYAGTGADAGANTRYVIFRPDQDYYLNSATTLRLVTATSLPNGAGQFRQFFQALGGLYTNYATLWPLTVPNDEDEVGHGLKGGLLREGDEVSLFVTGAAVDTTFYTQLILIPADKYTLDVPGAVNNGGNSAYVTVPAAGSVAAVTLYDSYVGATPGGATP